MLHLNPSLNFSLTKQSTTFLALLLKNKELSRLLALASVYKLPNWYIGGGSLPQIIWNRLTKRDLNYGLNDFDLVYFDPHDMRREVELVAQKRFNKQMKSTIKVEVVNEARTHIWFKKDFGYTIDPYTCTEDAIYQFPTTASAVGITLSSKTKRASVFAPHGLTDIFFMIVRANKIQITQKVFEEKARRWKDTWPELKIVPW